MGEPLPSDSGQPRLFRSGLLANLLHTDGHDVIWWTSAFDHQAKHMRTPLPLKALANIGYEIKQLRGCGYVSNVSLRRIIDQRLVASAFERQAASEVTPDVILASYPTIELCDAALDYARPRGIPVVVDMRDLWPDIFVNLAPSWAHKIIQILLYPMMRVSKRVCAGATAIIGITDAFVDWGVARAGRNRHAWDQACSLAYAPKTTDIASLTAARVQWNIRGVDLDKPIVCFFGALGRQFDIPCLIAAARRLADTPLQIVICGTGDRLDEYRQMAFDVPHVHFPGWVDSPSISALMERSLAGLAPYHNEMSFNMSVPNKAIEYLAGGLPIVSTLRGELEKLLNFNECGITIPEGDPYSLEWILRNLQTDTVRREKMAENSRKLYTKCFRADSVYGRLIEHLQFIATQNCQGHIPLALSPDSLEN